MNDDTKIIEELRSATRQEHLAYLLSLSEAEFDAVVEEDLEDLRESVLDEEWVRGGC